MIGRWRTLTLLAWLILAAAVGGESNINVEQATLSLDIPGVSGATNARLLTVVVSFEAHGNFHEIDLLLNDNVAETRINPPSVKAGQLTFTVDLSKQPDQVLSIAAAGYQGDRSADLATKSSVRQIVLDRTPPELFISAPTDGSVALNDGWVHLNLTYSDNLSGVRPTGLEVTIDGEGVGPDLVISDGAAAFTPVSPFAVGPHIYRVSATDAAGNVSNAVQAAFDVVHADAAVRIGPAGGTLVIESGPFAGAKVVVPEGALEKWAIIAARSVPDPIDVSNAAPVLELQPHGLLFRQDVTVALPSLSAEYESLLHAGLGDLHWSSSETSVCAPGLRCGAFDSFSVFKVFQWKLCRGEDDCTPLYLRPDDTPLPEEPPVLLIHGQIPFCRVGTGDYWGQMPFLLRAEGFSVWQLRYGTEAIQDAAAAVGVAVDRIRQVTGSPSVTLVAHSQGGLVARAYLQDERTDGGSIFRLITIGTPHLGTDFLNWGVQPDAIEKRCPAIRDMRPESEFLAALNALSLTSPKELAADDTDYVFLAGRNIENDLACTVQDGDGVVSVQSATAGVDGLYPLAFRHAYDGYPHTGYFLNSSIEFCNVAEQLQASPGDADHAIYQTVLKWARKMPAVDIMYLTGSYLKRANAYTGVERDSFTVGADVFRYAVSNHRQRVLLARGTTGWNNRVDVLDVASRTITHSVSASWVSTVAFLGKSDDEFVFNDASGRLWLHDLESGTTSLWQQTDTASQRFGKNTYRGGIHWSATGERVVVAIGVASAGGDGVFVGYGCDDGAGHHICGLSVLSNPAGYSVSWQSVATSPVVSSDGRYAYYVERVNWSEHSVWRHDLETGIRTALRQEFVSMDDGFGALSLVDDAYLTFAGLPVGGVRPVFLCDLRPGGECTPLSVPAVNYRAAGGIRW